MKISKRWQRHDIVHFIDLNFCPDLLHGFGEEGSKRKGLAPVTTDAILDLEEAGVYPRNKHSIDSHQQLNLAPCDQGLDNQVGGENNRKVL